MEFLISVAFGGLTVICSKVVELYRLLREPELDVFISLKTDRLTDNTGKSSNIPRRTIKDLSDMLDRIDLSARVDLSADFN